MYALILALILSLVLDLKKKNGGQFHAPNFFGPNTLMSKAKEKTCLNYMEIYHSGISCGSFCVTRDLETVHFICFHCSLYAACLTGVSDLGRPWLLCTRPMTSGPPGISTSFPMIRHSWLENFLCLMYSRCISFLETGGFQPANYATLQRNGTSE